MSKRPPLIPRTSVYGSGEGKLPIKALIPVRIVALIGVAFTIPVLAFTPRRGVLMALVLVGWLVGPPTWFAIEYFFIYKRYGGDVNLEEFKYGQEVMTRLWAGVAAALVAYLTIG